MPNKLNRNPFVSIGTHTPDNSFQNLFWIDTTDDNFILKFNYNEEWVPLIGNLPSPPLPIPIDTGYLKFGDNVFEGDNFKNIVIKVDDLNRLEIEKQHAGIKMYHHKDDDTGETFLTNDKIQFGRFGSGQASVFSLNKSSISLESSGKINIGGNSTVSITSNKLTLNDLISLSGNKVSFTCNEIQVGDKIKIKDLGYDDTKISASLKEIDLKYQGLRVLKISDTATVLNTRIDITEPERGNTLSLKKDGFETKVISSFGVSNWQKMTAGGNPFEFGVENNSNINDGAKTALLNTLPDGRIYIYGVDEYDGMSISNSRSLQDVISSLQANKLDNNYTADKIYGTDSLGAQTVYALGNGLAFENGQIICNINPTIPEETIGNDVLSKILEPNKVYIFESRTNDLTLLLATAASGIVNEYHMFIYTGLTTPTITWPTGILWNGNSAPTITANKTYEISILNNIAAYFEI